MQSSQLSFSEWNSIESTESTELVEYYFQYFLFFKTQKKHPIISQTTKISILQILYIL